MSRIFALIFICLSPLFARDRLQGWCEQGNKTITVNTVTSSTSTPVQRSYPLCTVTVFITGSGGSMANIYSNNSGTMLANPFTAASDGTWFFYADNGTYDVTFSGTISPPITQAAQSVIDPQNIGGSYYADTFPGANGCAQILAAATALFTQNTLGGVVDARGLIGTQTCSANPFGTFQGLTILLGGATYNTTVQWVVPAKSRLIGVGRGDAGTTNSVIKAVSGFPSSTAVVSLCSPTFGSPCQGVQVEHLTIDCNGQSGCIGGYNVYAQEESWFKHVMFLNFPNVGLWINGAPGNVPTFQTQNSGPYEDLELLPGASAVANTVCIEINEGVVSRGIKDVTCNANGYSVIPTSGIVINDTIVSVANVGLQDVAQGVLVGDVSLGENNAILSNVECGDTAPTNCSPVIHIANNSQNITLIAVRGNNTGGAGNVLVDSCNSVTVADNSVGIGLYSTGEGSCGLQSIITTRNDVNTVIQSPATQILSNVSIPGTGNSDGSIVVGQGANFKLYRVDSGTPGNTINSADAGGVTIQQTGMTAGPNGGGLYVQGGGVHGSTDPSTGIIGAGLQSDGGTTTAHATTAFLVIMNGGEATFFANNSLTPGATYSPSQRFKISLNGPVAPTFVFGSLPSAANGTFVYCSNCNNVVNNSAVAGATCVSSPGSGAVARRENGHWACN